MRSRVAWLLSTLALIATVPARADDLISRINVAGFTNFEFEKQIEQKGFGDPNGSFDVDTIGFVIDVHASDRVRVVLESDWSHGPDTGSNRGAVTLEYGFLEFTVSDLLKVRAGKFLTPFGIFNEVHNVSHSFLSVKLPSSTNKTGRIIKDAYLFYPRYSAGLALHGETNLGGRDVSYDVMLANGDTVTASAQPDVNPFEFDTNFAKSVTARFRIDLNQSLRLGTSFYYDSLTDKAANRILSYGVEMEYTRRQFKLISEAMLGWLRHLDGTTDQQLGWYVQGSWRFAIGLTPYVRLEQVNHIHQTGDEGYDLITGLNHQLVKNLFLKVENNHFWGGPKSSLGTLPGGKYNEIKAAVSFGF